MFDSFYLFCIKCSFFASLLCGKTGWDKRKFMRTQDFKSAYFYFYPGSIKKISTREAKGRDYPLHISFSTDLTHENLLSHYTSMFSKINPKTSWGPVCFHFLTQFLLCLTYLTLSVATQASHLGSACISALTCSTSGTVHQGQSSAMVW